MDWTNVSHIEVVDALREVEWTTPPRPLTEFFQKFSVPKNAEKWKSRLKCNLYYYRTNYFILSCFIIVCFFIRRPVGVLALALLFVAIACLNDRRPGVRGRPLRSTVYICGQDRRAVLALEFIVSFLLFYSTRLVYTFLQGYIFSVIFVILHASFRSPNLKARLNTYREDFRAVWRGYSDAP